MHVLPSTPRAPRALRPLPRVLPAVALLAASLGVAAPGHAHVGAHVRAHDGAARTAALVRRPYPGAGVAPGMEAAIRATWPVRLHRQALDVAWCESSGDPAARNGQYRGHFQMGRAEWERYGAGDPFDAEDNAAAAYRYFVAVGGSWRPWQCRPARS